MPHRIRFERVAARSKGSARAMAPISEWRSQPIARIGCCRPPPPQPSILAKRRSWEPTFHFAANWVLRVQDLNLAKGSNNRFRQAIKMLPCVLCRAPAIVGFAM